MTGELGEQLPSALRQRLAQPLPGLAKCWEAVPELTYGRHAGPPAHDARRAAVLALLYPIRGQWHVPLILRPETMAAHAGQVSLPGGEIEQGETIEEASVREFREELGAIGDAVEILGQLSEVNVYNSNFLVTPCVAWSPMRPALRPNPAEVANLLEPAVVELLDPTRCGSYTIERRGVRFRVPHLAYGDYKIWGATNLMLAELLIVIRDACS